MNTYRLIYSLITIIVRNNHHTQSDPYEIKYLFFGSTWKPYCNIETVSLPSFGKFRKGVKI